MQHHDAASHQERSSHWVPMIPMNTGIQLNPGAHFVPDATNTNNNNNHNNNNVYYPPYGTANHYSHGTISGYPGGHAQHVHQMHGMPPPGMDFSRGGGFYTAGDVYNQCIGGGAYHPHGNMQHTNNYPNAHRSQGRASSTTGGRSVSRGGSGPGVSARDMGGHGGGGSNGSNGRLSGPWDCPKCQNKNWSFRIECNRCSLRRPVGNIAGPGTTVYGPLPAPKGGHSKAPWDCRCGNHNYGFRERCNRCPLPRPGGIMGGPSAAVQAPRNATAQGGGPAVMDESTSNTVVPAVVDAPTASQELWSGLVEFGVNVLDTVNAVSDSIATLVGLAAEQAEIGAKWTMERGKDALDMASEIKDDTASLIGQVAEDMVTNVKELRQWLGKMVTWAVVCF